MICAEATVCCSPKRNGSPARIVKRSTLAEAGFNHSMALAIKIGKEMRHGQVLSRTSNPIQMMRWRSISPATISDVAGESTSDSPHGGVLTPSVSIINTLSKLTKRNTGCVLFQSTIGGAFMGLNPPSNQVAGAV